MSRPDPVFDAHLHVIDPRFPLEPNQGYVPDLFTVEDYQRAIAGLGVAGGSVVSGSFQAFDQTYLHDALARLGPGYVGVTQLPATVDDATVVELDRAGVRAVRFNLVRGGSADVDVLGPLARRVHDLCGWHVELYVDARDLADLEPVLAPLPAVVVDHLGLSTAGRPALLRHVERGGYVKATGFGRVGGDVKPLVRDIAAVNPGALLFGTDLPSTRSPRPFQLDDLDVLADALDPVQLRRALWDNAVALYRPGGVAA